MKSEVLEQQIINEADMIITTGCTLRECANYFKVSKSCVHVHMRKQLKELDTARYNQVNDILKYNLQHRHIRGGEATKMKYKARSSYAN